MAKRLLLTGHKGAVGRLLQPLLATAGWELLCADRVAAGTEYCDLRRDAHCARAVRGVNAIVHLAGFAKEATLTDLAPDNLLALETLLRSAVKAGVQHFVFASSMHIMGMYERTASFDESCPPRPDSYYAVSKLQGESLCRLFAEKSAMAICCLRLGSVTAQLKDADPGAWISPEDVVALIQIATSLPVPSFEILHCVADYDGAPDLMSRARSLGFRCSRSAGAYQNALNVAGRWWPNNDAARLHRGASFAAADLFNPRVD